MATRTMQSTSSTFNRRGLIGAAFDGEKHHSITKNLCRILIFDFYSSSHWLIRWINECDWLKGYHQSGMVEVKSYITEHEHRNHL